MKVLVIGGGGREHALCWKIAQSPRVEKIYCAPGNAGIASIAECVDLSAGHLDNVIHFARSNDIDLTVVGPEAPLCDGIVDRFEDAGLRIFGPNSLGAALEGSKIFCKNLLRKAGIPTASYRVYEAANDALEYLTTTAYPLVVKADGLAGGKGAIICKTEEEATQAVTEMMVDEKFGKAGRRIIIEEFMAGLEASILFFTDGRNLVTLESAQDHKAVFDGDEGPNTGGMGAYSPNTLVSDDQMTEIIRDILVPTVHAMKQEDRPYKGLLYAGIMMTKNGPKVLEYNVRFGDPECQTIMMRMKSDIIPLFEATIDEKLDEVEVEWDSRPAVTIVLASEGYPASYPKGRVIAGLADAEAMDDVVVFHAGTEAKGDDIVTLGGRVLTVNALGDTLEEARDRAYAAIEKITFEGAHYRSDIAAKALTAEV